MTSALVASGVFGALMLLVVALAVRRGRAQARLRMAEEALDVRTRQLEAANRRARNGYELARRLRAGEF
jgi:hypothetical protein